MSRLRSNDKPSRQGSFVRGASRSTRPLTDPNYTYAGGRVGLRECSECFARGGHEDWCARGE